MKLIISNKSKKEFKDFLTEKKIEYIESLDNPNLDPRIADHPDLSLFKLDEKNLVVAEEVFSYYKEKIPNMNLIKGQRVDFKYPKDAIYNIVSFKEYFIHNDFTEKNILKYFKDNNKKFLRVKQGYTRCSSLVLKDSILTSDFGIYKKLKDRINIILLKEEDIYLDGFDKGFIGGTSVLLDDKRLLFNGNIKKLHSYDIIYRQCERENIEIIYPDCQLADTGSMIVLN